ncbi:hypothetical protein As57867_006964, partial [Aphanomyces stellatus]
VVLTSFSPHMESLLLNVMHVVGCNSLVTKSALDKDLGHVLESCMAMGQQLIVHDVTPALYHAVFRELVEWTTEWVDETEFVVYQGHNVPLKGHFRLILTTHCSSCDFGSDIYAVTVVDSHACWDEMEHVLLDDIELSNVCNDKTSLGAYDYARNILDMEVDMERSLDALLTHLRSMIRESKYDSDMVNTLGSMCTLNAQHRTTLDEKRLELSRILALKADPNFAALTQLGDQLFSALQVLATVVPGAVVAFEPYGYRILFVHCLDTCLADARAKATAARVCSPADLLAKLLDQLSFSIPQEHWTTLLFLLALEMRSKTLGSNTILKDSPPSETMSPPQDSFRTLQRRVFFSPATLDCVTPAAVQALTSCSPDEIFLAHDACTQDVSLGKQRRRPSHANVSILQDAAVAALLRSVPVAHLCLLLMLECPRPAYDSFCTALYVHTLAKQSAARGRGGNKEWFKALQSTSDDWYWCIASPCVFTSMDLLHLMLETTVPRETWPDVLKLLLQRTDVQALTFQVPQDVETSVVGLFDSIATMNQFEGQHPGSFEALKWIVLDMDAPEKWDALLQFNKKFRLDYRPVGLISHQKVNMGKPKHQQRHHAADDDMPSTRFVHVVASLPS